MSFGFTRIINGIQIVGQSATAPDTAGEIRYNPSIDSFQGFDTALRAFVLDTATQTLTNKILSSQAANPALSGAIRLGNTELINWRNAGNSNDIGISLDGSNNFLLGSNLNVNAFDLQNVNSLMLLGSSSGTLELHARATTTNYSLTFPAAQGLSLQTLKNNGSGLLAWAYSVDTIGTIDGQSPSANGLVINNNSIFAQSASLTVPGMVNNTTQSFSGAKTFQSASQFTAGLDSFGNVNIHGNNIINSGTLTLPTSTDTLVGRATTDTLTNKTFGDAVTFTQVSTPTTPSAGKDVLWFDSGSNLNWKTPSGTILTASTSASGEPRDNFLYNSNFDFWQRATSGPTANASSAYLVDRWYTTNSLGTNGVITVTQVAGVSDGSKYGMSVKITTAPTASQSNGCEAYQVLENLDSLMLYNQTASFSIKIKALGNVNQVGLQFMYNTTEAKVNTTIGSEQIISVNSGSFSLGSIAGQALGTSMTSSGVIGIRIRIVGVSTGNTYDLNNGFVLEQGILNIGSTPSSYQRMFKNIGQEYMSLLRYFEKSYAYANPVPSSSDESGMITGTAQTGGTTIRMDHPYYQVVKRTSPGVSIYSYVGTNGFVSNFPNTSNNSAVTAVNRASEKGIEGFDISPAVLTNTQVWFNWSAEAEI